jgi:hypothetical protein
MLLSVATLAVAILVCVSSAFAATGAGAGSMTLATADFPVGAALIYEGPQLIAGFPRFNASSSYSRTFRDVALGTAKVATLESSVSVAKKTGDPASLMSSLIATTRSAAGRKSAADQVKTSLGKSLHPTSVSMLRGRVIKAGESAVEMVFRLQTKSATDRIEIGELWVKVGSALSLTVFATNGPGVTAGNAASLAHLVATHMKTALELAPKK